MYLVTPEKAITALEEQVIFPNQDLKPKLGIIVKKQVNKDEQAYLRSITKQAEKYNATYCIDFVSNYHEMAESIHSFKANREIYGIIVLSSLGDISTDRAICDMIPPRLDIDCMSSTTLGLLMTDSSPIAYRLGPCAPAAAIKILEYENVDLKGKKVAVVGRSLRVGRPLAEMFCKQDATVTLFHSKSDLTALYNEKFDVIVSAIGRPKFFTKSDFVNDLNDTFLIDIGINVDEKGHLCGDFDTDSFEDEPLVKITPAPGCIGKLTTTILFAKLFSNAYQVQKGDIHV